MGELRKELMALTAEKLPCYCLSQ